MILVAIADAKECRRMAANAASSRAGLTMLELLVAMGILGILLAIMLPAVQQARVTARDLQCKNNLRQVGLAMHQFQEQAGKFPGTDCGRQLLPFLDQSALMDKIAGRYYVHGSPEDVAAAEEFFGASTPVLACPADPVQSLAGYRALSYHINDGTGYGGHEDGFRHKHTGITPADVTDGLSQTAAFSERLVYRGHKEPGIPDDGPFTPTRDQRLRRTATTDAYHGADQIDQFADACRDDAVWFGGTAGWICTPLGAGCGGFDYNHIMTPNQNSCFNGVPASLDFKYQRYAAHTASSLHYGGVHVLLGDGAVRFVSDSIDRKIWRALGTRNGQEPNALAAF
jgi:prepilin-type N-terminal cleavage/methylation domain-containing protein